MAQSLVTGSGGAIAAGKLVFSAWKSGGSLSTTAGKVLKTMVVAEAVAPAATVHWLAISNLPADSLGGDIESSVTVVGLPGLMDGTLNWGPSAPPTGSGLCRTATGRLTGPFTAKFDIIGARRITDTGLPATFTQCG